MWPRMYQDFADCDPNDEYMCVKTHVMSPGLTEGIMENLLLRGLEHYVLDTTPKCNLDRAGMCLSTRSWQDVELPGGLTVGVPSEHVEHFLDRLEDLGERREVGTPYYKLHSWLVCLCMTPEERDILLEGLRAVLVESNALAEVERQQFMDAFRGSEKVVVVQAGESPTEAIARAEKAGKTPLVVVAEREPRITIIDEA